MSIVRCPKCDSQISNQTTVCPHCKSVLSPTIQANSAKLSTETNSAKTSVVFSNLLKGTLFSITSTFITYIIIHLFTGIATKIIEFYVNPTHHSVPIVAHEISSSKIIILLSIGFILFCPIHLLTQRRNKFIVTVIIAVLLFFAGQLLPEVKGTNADLSNSFVQVLLPIYVVIPPLTQSALYCITINRKIQLALLLQIIVSSIHILLFSIISWLSSSVLFYFGIKSILIGGIISSFIILVFVVILSLIHKE